MRLDDHRVAGDQAREQRRVDVPGGEARTGDHHGDPLGHQPVPLHHLHGGGAERARPPRRAGHPGHRRVRLRDRLDAAVERVGSAAGVTHPEALPGGVHRRVRELEGTEVDPLADLQAHPGPGPRVGLPPVRPRPGGGGEQLLDVRPRVAHAQRLTGVGETSSGCATGAPGPPRSKGRPSSASNASLPSARARSPPGWSAGDSPNAVQLSRERHASIARSRVARCLSNRSVAMSPFHPARAGVTPAPSLDPRFLRARCAVASRDPRFSSGEVRGGRAHGRAGSTAI